LQPSGVKKKRGREETGSMNRGLLWEEFEAGARWRTGSRLVSAADVEQFSGLSGDSNLLHLDDAYARGAGFQGRIAHGVLGLAVATGLLNQLGVTRGTLVALLGTTWTFLQPIYPGTRVHAEIAVERVAPTSRRERGIVILGAALADEEGTVYQRGEFTLLVRRRAANVQLVTGGEAGG
jgi:3-hydroxybutyryl-CoA dehydratase